MTEGAFEARKWGWRQTKEGIVVSFLVHPNDINAALAVAPLGTIYAIGFREMPEGDQSASPEADAGHGAPAQAVVSPPAPTLTEAVAVSAPKQRRQFGEMPRSQQAGMLCQDERFQEWMKDYCGRRGEEHPDDAQLTAQLVREACNIASRAQIDTDTFAIRTWDNLVYQFRSETGQMAEQRA